MLLRREGVIALGSEFMMLDIAVLVGAVRHLVERQVRNFGQRLLQRFVGRLGVGFQLRLRLLQRRDLGHQRIGARVVLGLLGLADFLRRRVASRLRRSRTR